MHLHADVKQQRGEASLIIRGQQCLNVQRVCLQGSIFTCPIGGFQLSSAPPAGRLAGLHCYAAASSAAVELGVTAMATVESQVILPKQSLSAGAAFGIFVCVVLILGAIGGVGYMLWQRRVRSFLLTCLLMSTWHLGATCHG